MKPIFTILFSFFTILTLSQTKISGRIINEKNNPITGSNVFIEGSYDGAYSNDNGEFTFETSTNGNQVLVITNLGYVTKKIPFIVGKPLPEAIILKESVNTLDAVVITAGTFEAGEKARIQSLKPLDIVTTAGSNGDIVAALQSLPGTQTVGEDGRLFVRGGEADETQTFIDGIRVAQPYGTKTADLPTRGRFSPFLFNGISFSTGGYSAEYGEALSGVLLLNTTDEATQEKTDISLMTVGLGLANTQVWNKSSITVNAAYVNLAPYQALVPQNVDWNKPFQSLSGETIFRHQFGNGLFKLYAAFDAATFDLNQESINYTNKIRVDLNNNNFYLNSSYKANLGNKWQLTTGLAYGYGNNKIVFNTDKINNDENSAHFKIKARKTFSDRVKLIFGTDYFVTQFNENYNAFFDSNYTANLFASYAEADVFLSKNLAFKAGLRFSNNSLLNQNALSPRASLGYKLNKTSQFSLAYGQFEQAPKQDYLKYNHNFENEKAAHYIFNYQYNSNKRTLKTELYYKDYSNLVKYDGATAMYNSIYNNNGYGFAKGLDVFWRDNKTFKYLEYWVSYSYIDTQRNYKNYTAQVTPSFVAKHNLSLVTKYWIDKWKSQVGFSYNTNSGRPYNNPNETVFMNGKTKTYSNLSFNWAYLLSQQKILYFSVTNVLGTQNVFGYEYANSPDANGYYNRREIIPTADRFFFVGFFWTISNDKKDNQLKNL